MTHAVDQAGVMSESGQKSFKRRLPAILQADIPRTLLGVRFVIRADVKTTTERRHVGAFRFLKSRTPDNLNNLEGSSPKAEVLGELVQALIKFLDLLGRGLIELAYEALRELVTKTDAFRLRQRLQDYR